MPGLPAGFQSVPAHSGASAAAGFGLGASATSPICSAAACRSTTGAAAPVLMVVDTPIHLRVNT